MKILTVNWRIGFGRDPGTEMRALTAGPPPMLVGLRSRHFRLEERVLRGSYQFDSDADIQEFACKLKFDAAVAKVSREGGFEPKSFEIESATSIIETIASEPVFDRPVFVIAAPFAGGTLLLDYLSRGRAFSKIAGEDNGIIEGVAGLHPGCRGWDSHSLTELDADRVTVDALRVAYLQQLRDNRASGILQMPTCDQPTRLRFVDRTSENTLRVRFLASVFPDARFVFMHRDARQNVSSLLKAWRDDASIRIPSLPGWSRGAWHSLLPQHWRDYDHAPLVDVAAFQWGSANEQALDDLGWLARDRWIVVDYAELIASPRTVVTRVLDLAGLDKDEALNVALPPAGFEPSSPIKWRSNPEFNESALAPHNVVRGRLRELGGPSAPPPDRSVNSNLRFACLLDQLNVDPASFSCNWIVHPSYRFQIGLTVPSGMVQRTRFRDRFVRDLPLAWVEDDTTEIFYPFWVERQHLSLLRRLEPGQPPPAIERVLGLRLAAAGVLITPDDLALHRQSGEEIAEKATPLFDAQRYCVLPSLIRPDHVAALARYYDALVESGMWAFGDSQVSQRYGWHNESVARYFHHQLTRFVSRVVGERVRPSYCYVSAYRGGRASLRPHVDRKQCVFTISLWIGDRTSVDPAPWPLWFHTPNGIVSVTQSASDAVLFRGCELPHWRDQPPPGGASTALIFHYVPNDFVGVLD